MCYSYFQLFLAEKGNWLSRAWGSHKPEWTIWFCRLSSWCFAEMEIESIILMICRYYVVKSILTYCCAFIKNIIFDFRKITLLHEIFSFSQFCAHVDFHDLLITILTSMTSFHSKLTIKVILHSTLNIKQCCTYTVLMRKVIISLWRWKLKLWEPKNMQSLKPECGCLYENPLKNLKMDKFYVFD